VTAGSGDARAERHLRLDVAKRLLPVESRTAPMPSTRTASSSSRMGTFGCSSRSWRMYQSVLSRLRFTTRTSLRKFSTSCMYHSGNVSLSPFVNTNEFGLSGASML